jgi:DNA sulfur modification protein DndB
MDRMRPPPWGIPANMRTIKLNALKVLSQNEREIYSMAMKSQDLVAMSHVLHASRNEKMEVVAYQRPEMVSHIKEIAEYLKTVDALLPNAVVVAMNPALSTFTPFERQGGGIGVMGELLLEMPPKQPPLWIIDGQQRTMALKESGVEDFPIFVSALRDVDIEFQRQQFVNVNSAKPLPRALIYELLPHLDKVPAKYRNKVFPIKIAETLAVNERSPFFGIVKFAAKSQSISPKDEVVEFNSLVAAMAHVTRKNSGFTAKKIKNGATKGLKEVEDFYIDYWCSVKKIFPNAWGMSPKESRLMHGVGIWGMTTLADEIATRFRRLPTPEETQRELMCIADKMAWTKNEGKWVNIDGIGENIAWNKFQNTATDKNTLSAFIRRKWRISYEGSD